MFDLAGRTVTFEWNEADHPRDDHGRFGEGSDDAGPREVAAPTTLSEVSPQLRAEIADRAETSGRPADEQLSPGWQNAAAWEAIMSPAARELEDPKAANPDRYAPNKGFGV